MDKEQWLSCCDPDAMVQFVKDTASDSKLRLFVCGCYRNIWSLLSSQEQILVMEAEQLTDSHESLESARGRLCRQFASDLEPIAYIPH